MARNLQRLQKKMIGPPLREIELELESMHPASVYSESLSPDSINDEEEEPYFTIETPCTCGSVVRVMVQASHRSLRSLQTLLLGDVRLLCRLCAEIVLEHGRH